MGIHFFTFSSLSLLISIFLSPLSNAQRSSTFEVGVILDNDTLVGDIGITSLSLALSDFYSSNPNYSTRLVLHTRDSGGQVTGAAATALTLLRDGRVDAIIGPQKSAQANFVIGLGDSAKVPIISFSATSPSLRPTPNTSTSSFVQTALNDAAQVEPIAAIIKYFQWCQVALVYEDSDYGNGIIPYLSNALQEANARVSYRSVIPLSASDDFILKELYKMKTMPTRVFVVHTSSSLAPKFFLKVKEAEMMSQGYVWIVTSTLMDLFPLLDSDVVKSMQGVLGVKPMVPRSSKLSSTTARWKRKFANDYPIYPQQAEMNLYTLWAYDTLWALAMAAEKVGFTEPRSFQNNTSTTLNSTNMFILETSQTGPKLLGAMLETEFEGLAGNFHLVNGQLEPPSFQILNIFGKELREVGMWTQPSRLSSSQRNSSLTGFSGERLDIIKWPGDSTNVPKGWEVPVSGKKLRIGVPAEAGFPEFIKVEKDPQTNATTTISGYYIDLFDSVMAALPYAVRYEYVPFEKNGSMAGSYSELSYQVYIGNYDAAVGDITITANRSKYVDFTLPIEEGGITMTQVIKYKDPNKKLFFLKPLNRDLWLTAIALFILTGVSIWILEHRFNRAFRGPPSAHVGLILYIPFMSLVFANSERIVSNVGRFVLVVWMFVVLILSSTYTASLSAQLTALKLQPIDTDISALNKTGDYVGCREGSFTCEYLINSGFNSTKIRKYNSSEAFHVALSNRSAKGGITTMFARTPYTKLFLSKYCNKYMTVGHPILTKGLAFVFPRGSPLVADVSRAITKLTDNHKIADIKGRWIRDSDSTTCTKDDTASWSSITLKSFRILFGITGGITATCLVVFLLSYLYNNRDFIRRISNSGSTTWSKIRAVCMHFDQRDPKSFRYKEDVQQQSRSNRVVPDPVLVPTEERPGENGAAAAHQISPA